MGFYLVPANTCTTLAEFNNRTCNFIIRSEPSSTKPKKISTPNFTAGNYRWIVGNFADVKESFSLKVVLAKGDCPALTGVAPGVSGEAADSLPKLERMGDTLSRDSRLGRPPSGGRPNVELVLGPGAPASVATPAALGYDPRPGLLPGRANPDMGLTRPLPGQVRGPDLSRGPRRRQRDHHDARRGRQVGTALLDLADAVRHRLLRDRVHGAVGLALRHRPLRRRGAALLAAPGRPDVRGRHDPRQARPGPEDDLRPDARAQVGDLDGRLRLVGRLLPLVPRDAGDRRDHPGGRLRARLPAVARGPDRGAHEDPGQDQERRAGEGAAGRPTAWARPATAPSTAAPGARRGRRTTRRASARASARAASSSCGSCRPSAKDEQHG